MGLRQAQPTWTSPGSEQVCMTPVRQENAIALSFVDTQSDVHGDIKLVLIDDHDRIRFFDFIGQHRLNHDVIVGDPMARSFVAVEIKPRMRDMLQEMLHDLQNEFPAEMIRWVKPAGIHLTLKFLGEISEAKIQDVSTALKEAASVATPFCIKAEGLGCFPNPRRPRILWVGVMESGAALQDLHRRINLDLQPLGFELETRCFHPHLTLGRVRHPRRIKYLEKILLRYSAGSDWEYVQQVCLMRSVLSPSGAVYSKISTVHLQKENIELSGCGEIRKK